MTTQSTQQFSRDFGGRTLQMETGRVAGLADGAVTLRYGDTVILATVVVGKEPREGVDFFPLLVDYEERLYAAGKISGSRWVKREGRPSENAILTARLIDRPLRPLFPKTFRNDVQVIVTILAFDGQNDPDVLAIVAASTALLQTNAPFTGPIAAARVGLVDGEFVLNPTRDQMEKSTLDLVVAGTPDRVMMLEAGMSEIEESKIEEAIQFAQASFGPLIDLQHEVAAATKRPPAQPLAKPITTTFDDVLVAVKETIADRLPAAVILTDRVKRQAFLAELGAEVATKFEGKYKQAELKNAVTVLFEKEIRRAILEDNIRPDGRAIDEVRPLGIEVDILPRVHGSALFSRGETQVISIVTLGAPGDEQMIETMEEETTKRFMHHYNFPPFSVGEVRPMRGASRRDVGHGALVERALTPILPERDAFPYTVRVVSEVLSSNGSSSMGSTCGSMLALLAAGVPVKGFVAGIAMGLVTNREPSTEAGKPSTMKSYKVLTDLQGLEDFSGDMDFKVAGTDKGVTAIQLDIKIDGLTKEIIHDTFEKARVGRLFIRDKMMAVIPGPRPELSEFAPRITALKIAVEKIGELIGPGGKVINKIIADCGGKEVLTIDIEDDGIVTVSSHDAEAALKA
ncbi:MAG: polyribonucleotide nucleotidyltransferase, partial [Patescibacteria group bacterium]